MRGLPSCAAVAAVVSTASSATVPLHLVRSSESPRIAAPSADGSFSFFDWALASSLAGLTGAPPTSTTSVDWVPNSSSLPVTRSAKDTCVSSATSSIVRTKPTDHTTLASASATTSVSSITSNIIRTKPADHTALASASPTTSVPSAKPNSSKGAPSPTGHGIAASATSAIHPVFVPATKTCAGPAAKSPEVFWLDDQDHNNQGAGIAPFVNSTERYPVFRNVMDYSVVNDGSGDQTAKLQKAIDDDGAGGSRKGHGVTRYPAEVYLPGGEYRLGSTLSLTVGTIIVGNPLNPPVLKAAPGFKGDHLIMGYDEKNGAPETSFATLLKNVILDTTALDPSRGFTALQWGVAQGSGLTNVKIRMPPQSTGHTGIDLKAGSTIAVTDVDIIGGAVGIRNSNQQVNFKNIYFQACKTGFHAIGGWTVLLQGATFDSCGTGIDMTGNGLGSLVLLDSLSTNNGPVIRFYDSSRDHGNQNSQFLIQNLKHNGQNAIAVDTAGQVALAATSHIETWVWGTVVPTKYEAGVEWRTERSPQLLVGDKFFTKAQPTYQDYHSADIVNVKTVPGYTVKGDGKTDDTKALNAILAENAESCKVTYIPFGIYRVSDTIFVPVGTRIVGEAWPVISGYGDNFKDVSNPRAVVKLGNPGDVGLIEIQDMRFSVGEILPGAKLIEINAAGNEPGEVGLWNTMATVGGTAETSISGACTSQDPKNCMAAFMVMHLTESSSAYIENFWGWTADHNLDSESILTIISTGRGILVEATKGTWLTGTGSEHHWLYNYNFHNAKNVFAGLLQTETPYMQGQGEYEAAPAPWAAEPKYGDPDFSWCATEDQKCRTALATNVDGGSDVALYNSAAWAFFDGYWNGLYNEPCSGNCQSNMMRVTNNPTNLVWYSISTRMTDVMVLDNKTNPRESNHKGGWEAIIQVYGQFTT